MSGQIFLQELYKTDNSFLLNSPVLTKFSSCKVKSIKKTRIKQKERKTLNPRTFLQKN